MGHRLLACTLHVEVLKLIYYGREESFSGLIGTAEDDNEQEYIIVITTLKPVYPGSPTRPVCRTIYVTGKGGC